MRTIQLTDALAKKLVRDIARKWAENATTAAIDFTARIWDKPGPTDRDRHRKWLAKLQADAAAYSKMLWAFEIETPSFDTSTYVTPINDWYIKNASAKPGDVKYNYRRRLEVVDVLVSMIMDEPPPDPKPEDKSRELVSAMLKSLNNEMAKHLK